MWFTRVSIKNPVFAVMVVLGLVVLGIMGYKKMAVDQFPDVEIPVIVVQTTYSGASPASVETSSPSCYRTARVRIAQTFARASSRTSMKQ